MPNIIENIHLIKVLTFKIMIASTIKQMMIAQRYWIYSKNLRTVFFFIIYLLSASFKWCNRWVLNYETNFYRYQLEVKV